MNDNHTNAANATNPVREDGLSSPKTSRHDRTRRAAKSSATDAPSAATPAPKSINRRRGVSASAFLAYHIVVRLSKSAPMLSDACSTGSDQFGSRYSGKTAPIERSAIPTMIRPEGT